MIIVTLPLPIVRAAADRPDDGRADYVHLQPQDAQDAASVADLPEVEVYDPGVRK
jgi:hypothetical protein